MYTLILRLIRKAASGYTGDRVKLYKVLDLAVRKKNVISCIRTVYRELRDTTTGSWPASSTYFSSSFSVYQIDMRGLLGFTAIPASCSP